MSGILLGTLIQGLPTAVSPAQANDNRPNATSHERPVKGTTATPKPRRVDYRPPTPRPATKWPAAGTLRVDLPAPNSLAAAPGKPSNPVTFAAPTPHKNTARKAAQQTPAAKADLRFLDRATARQAGIDGVLLTLGNATTGTRTDPLKTKITLDYSGFARAAGGGYGSRLSLVQLPTCALTTPEKPECRTQTPIPGSNDTEAETLTADAVSIPPADLEGPQTQLTVAPAGATVLAAVSGTSSLSGDFKGSPLGSASTWSTALNTGAFSWSYGMEVPSTPGDLTPNVSMSYSSALLDGRTVNSNNQASWAGDGFDISPGFVERSYKPCADEGVKKDGIAIGDLCWAYDNATISFDGHAGELIPVSKDEWRIKGDDGTKVTRTKDTARGNNDNDGEYFTAVTPEGTTYYFGYNRLTNWATGKPETKSVFTVPVYGNNTGEPCNTSDIKTSWCNQGWRWNLDMVVDAKGNDITYWYTQEANSYGRYLTAADDTPYVRGGTLDHIEYGQQQTDIYSATVKPMAKVNFTPAERCLETTTSLCDPAKIDTNRQYWYDTPWDMNCKAGTDCNAGRLSPTFFTRTRLAQIKTQTLQTDGTYKDIDSWTLKHKWGTADADYQLLLESIEHTGLAGLTPVTLPATTLTYTQRTNRLDKTGDGRAPFVKERLGAIDDEGGGTLDINYSGAACSWSSLPTPQTNTTRCYPQRYQASSESPITDEWFNKYVVDAVIATDRTGNSPDMVTRYTYLGTPAWHFDDDDGLTKEKLKTWSQWRGYNHTRVQTGSVLDMSSQIDHWFLRGMDGDRSDPADKTKERDISFADGEGGTLVDDPAWAGFEYRTEAYSAPGGSILNKAVNKPWKKQTASRIRDWGTSTANLTGTEVARTFTSLDNGAGAKWQEVRSETDFDAFGRATQTEQLGDVTIASDDQCTRTTYPAEAAPRILNAPIHTETVAANCDTAVNRDTRADGTSAVISDTRTRYDGKAYGAAPTKGLPTLIETLKNRSGNKATYLDNAATFDTYGRPLTTTALASTTLFDPTNESATPVTTANSGARTTTTAYTPAVGRPTKTVSTTPPATAGIAASAQTTTTTLDSLRGLPTTETDANNLRTDATYDALGRQLKLWKPDRSKANGQTPNIEYRYHNPTNGIHSVETLTLNNDGSQASGFALYDGFGRQRQTQTPGDNNGKILTDTFYDARGNVERTHAPYYATGAPTGQLFKLEDTTGVESQTTTEYDGLSRQTKVTQLAGNGVGSKTLSVTRTIYGGDRVTVIPPKGGTTRTSIADSTGRVSLLKEFHGTEPAGPADSTTYEYDPSGQLIKLTDPSNNVWTWTYDQLGRQVASTDPDAGTINKKYNDKGELTSATDGNTKTVAYTYDNLSRQIESREGSITGPLLTSQTWDPTGNKGMANTSTRYVTVGTTTYQYKTTANIYDALYRPTRTTLTVPSIPGQEALAGSYITGTAYNLDGTVRSVAYPAAGNLAAESLAFTYDNLRRPVTASSNLSGYLGKQTYSLTSKPLQSTLNAGGKSIWTTNAWEFGTQRLSGTRTDLEGANGAERATAFTYDEVGNVTALSDNSRYGQDTQCFTYDHLARLTEAFTPTSATCPAAPTTETVLGGPAPYWTSWSYNTDGTRNTETQHDPSGVTTADRVRSYAYPVDGAARPHSLLETSTLTGGTGTPVTESYKYDDAGNTTERHRAPGTGTTSDQILTWNAEGNLIKVADTVKKLSGSTTVTTTETTDFVYTADGSRLLTHTLDTANPTQETTTLHLGTTELKLAKGAAKPTATRYYELGTATAVRTDSNNVSFQITDHHNTGTLDIDASGAVVDQRRMTPFGRIRGNAPTGWAGTRGFIGGTMDPTELTHLGAREYDPDTGRFISVDPVLAPQDIQSLNGYVYANNNPMTLSDPSGQRPDGACSGRCTDGSRESWSGGPGNWQYTIISKPDSKGHSKVQHVDFRDHNRSFTVYARVIPPKKPKPKVVVETRNSAPYVNGVCAYAMGMGCGGDITRQDKPAAESIPDLPCPAGESPTLCGIRNSMYKTGIITGMTGGSIGFFGLRSGKVTTASGRPTARPGGTCPTPHSFPAGTLVLMADGSVKPIEKMRIGDEVLATDPKTGKSAKRKVDATFLTPDDREFTTIAVVANGALREITATGHHPFWSPSAKEWVDASDAKPGMTLLSVNGQALRITEVRDSAKMQVAYDLTIRSTHTYYVLAGTAPLLVHNCNVRLTQEEADTLEVGPYANGSVPATGSVVTPAQSAAMQGRVCHTCGGTTPTMIGDHQPSTGIGPGNLPRNLFPHCKNCSDLQSAAVQKAQRMLREHGYHDPTFAGLPGYPSAREMLVELLPGHTQ
ncbi:polymorphic toxin-type HINT domain-containing protein [Streptomyces sp. NPDC090301]|uniref:polymorphic toxin-type HINT domain-containing protein n=1 Tax=Streptomyces sp. NPDC090301 TaxID=3154975 RepID=UPI0034361F4D